MLIAPGCTGWLVRRRRDPELTVGDLVEVRVARYDDGAPVLERPPRAATSTTVPAPVSSPTVRPGPHLFRRTPAPPQQAPVTPPSQHPAGLPPRVAELEELLAEAQEERLAAEQRAEAAEHGAGQAIRQLSRSARELMRRRDCLSCLRRRFAASRFDEPIRVGLEVLHRRGGNALLPSVISYLLAFCLQRVAASQTSHPPAQE